MSKTNADSEPKKGTGDGSREKAPKEKMNGSAFSFGNLLRLALVVAGVSVMWNYINVAPYTKVVHISSGPIRGEELTFGSIHYKAFKGILYAAPPVGNLKFKPPELPQKWTEVRDTTKYGNICHQPKRTGNLFKMDPFSLLKVIILNGPNMIRSIFRMRSSSEDCLTLNVFTKSFGENGLKPVLFWIHGGGFFAGDGSDSIYGPQYLLQDDIVVVTINYRIGPLGFLAANTPEATGNAGLKDQVAALRWVQDNIVKFGGDPKQVTIYGESAGGTSVHLHLFSPLSKGLFHKAIATSGTASNFWALSDQHDRFSKNLARLMGGSESDIEDPTKRVQFLRSVDSKAMTDRLFDVFDKEDTGNPFFNPLPFVPVIEPAGTKGAFLTEKPMHLLAQGKFTKVPMMMGATDLEGGLIYMGLGKNSTTEAIKEVENNLCTVLANPLKDGVITKNDCSKISEVIKKTYFGGKSFDTSQLEFIHFLGDLLVVKELHKAQREHAKYSDKNTPLYNYHFIFDGQWNMLKQLFKVTLPGALHGDDLTYIFKPLLVHLPDLEASSREVITKNRMISFITNFVKYGNPTPSTSDLVPVKWEPATKKEPATVLIINDELKLEKQFMKSRMDMWNQIYLKYTGLPLFT